jgi:hypothetical protein
MKTKILNSLLILTLVFGAAAMASGADDKWIHIKVDDGDEQVMVNLPLSLVRAALAIIPEEVHQEVRHEMEVGFDELHMEWDELLQFWEAVKEAPEAKFVTVQTRDEKIEVMKKGQYVLVQTSEVGEHGTQIDVKFPLAVIDALLSGGEGRLNFEAAIEALANEGYGHLVSVRDGDDTVKIWIDDKNESDG